MENMKPMGPLNMGGNAAENWGKWKQRWNLYAKASGASEKDEATHTQSEMQPSRRASKTNRCSRCGSSHGPKQSPALGQTCHKCHGNNHFAKMCRSKALHTPYTKSRLYKVRKDESTDESSAEESELFIGELMKTTTTGNILVTNSRSTTKA